MELDQARRKENIRCTGIVGKLKRTRNVLFALSFMSVFLLALRSNIQLR